MRIDPLCDDGQIANLAKGKIGANRSDLLGGFLISQFEQAVLSRADPPAHERQDHFLFVEEFQNYAVGSIARMMAESRKFGASLIVACQFTAVLLPEIRDAIFGNCGTLLSMRGSEKDAKILSGEYGRFCTAGQFADLANFEVLVKALDNGR